MASPWSFIVCLCVSRTFLFSHLYILYLQPFIIYLSIFGGQDFSPFRMNKSFGIPQIVIGSCKCYIYMMCCLFGNTFFLEQNEPRCLTCYRFQGKISYPHWALCYNCFFFLFFLTLLYFTNELLLKLTLLSYMIGQSFGIALIFHLTCCNHVFCFDFVACDPEVGMETQDPQIYLDLWKL